MTHYTDSAALNGKKIERHDVVLANGLSAESYIDVDNRLFFDNDPSYRSPDAPGRTLDDYCSPFAAVRPLVEAVRDVLWQPILALGWTHQVDVVPEMHLIADGERVQPVVAANRARFVIPAAAQDVWLHTATAIPRHVLNTGDGRRLGLLVTGIAVTDGLEVGRVVGPADERLCIGFHEAEQGGVQRWTAGRSRLPCEL